MTELFFIMLLSVVGFVNAYFLHWQYKRFLKTKQKMYCLIGEDCIKVVSSRYGTTLGIKNEIIGMWYYAVLLFLMLVSFVSPTFTQYSRILSFMSSLVAALFSFYLLYVQTRILKTYCSWCLIAIGLNTLIFVLVLNLVL